MTNWKHYRTALLSALDSVGMFDVLTPTELDAVATHLATSLRDKDEIAPHASDIKTLRDYFAAKAMQGDWASQSSDTGEFTNNMPSELLKSRAEFYYRMADAMLAARGQSHE